MIDYVTSLIVDEFFWAPANTGLVICVLKLKNGSVVVGEARFKTDAERTESGADAAKKKAFQKAREQIYLLERYLKNQKIYEGNANELAR